MGDQTQTWDWLESDEISLFQDHQQPDQKSVIVCNLIFFKYITTL